LYFSEINGLIFGRKVGLKRSGSVVAGIRKACQTEVIRTGIPETSLHQGYRHRPLWTDRWLHLCWWPGCQCRAGSPGRCLGLS